MPSATVPTPTVSTRRPRRAVALSLFMEVMIAPIANGLLMRPVSRAPWPKPSCQTTESVKKMLVNDAK